MISIVLESREIIPQKLEKMTGEVETWESMETIQNTSLLKIDYLDEFWDFKETYCHLLSIEAGVKNRKE